MAPPRETCSSGDLQHVTKRYVHAFVGEGAAALDLAEPFRLQAVLEPPGTHGGRVGGAPS
jgi:hypothetical protein